ncbi:1,4-alpha-glucan branching protein [Thermococcus thioreducens]|uniref:1,4-alpha-glucan branching enzyme n=1 Tax=Thermococcus thioreducens TaxID=277988 RepID=A0A0Q2S2F0_9EURY|nr:1,4-alpha-glucan branching protein [Thermococcus thioreducens]ASJ11917.1 1,4-alpha-glucan branching protein [Thermococcus thioreducens]KQH81675.1 1,4-alpha-glucan branching protein [Thermococcus thioreducens]SEW11562.1 1,4-alpha-glucan branching enzyme [Thermococcus thioreducens]
MKGYFTFVLHTHLPYVRKHGRWPFGEEWLYEAMSETYIPLLMEFERLRSSGIRFQLVINITPVLAEQLADDYIKAEFERYLLRKIETTEEDLKSGRYDEKAVKASLGHFRKVYDYWRAINGDIVGKFREFQDEGYIEIITSAATHGYLPLLGRDEAIRAQLANGIATYEKHFGRRPRGIWLPECAYRPAGEWELPGGRKVERPGIEKFLEEFGIEYFFVESSLIDEGPVTGGYGEIPLYGGEKSTLRPYWVKGSSVAVFARNRETGHQVWSAHYGYPGDFWYREFHRKAPESGGQYWRITGKDVELGEKEFYDPDKAMERVEEHARHFVSLVEGLLVEFEERAGERGIVVSPYDTELFGHWWFEGVKWLGRVLELMAERGIVTTTLSTFLDNYRGERYEIELPEGSWGANSDHSTWWNKETEWTWGHLYRAEERMVALASRYYGRDRTADRILEQLARELLILEASDWQFLITTGQAKEYGKRRILIHSRDFHRLANELERYVKTGKFDSRLLEELEERDNAFRPVVVASYVSENPPEFPEYVEPPEVPSAESERPAERHKNVPERAYATEVVKVAAIKSPSNAEKPSRSKRVRRTGMKPGGISKKGEKHKVGKSDLLMIKGIGPKTLAKLQRAGVHTVEDLKNADIEELARKTRISPKRLRKFLAQIS